ncbi:MAG: hypothetical protein P8186_01170 [Anaerolineae bacterium]|jgi:hypothetical protein
MDIWQVAILLPVLSLLIERILELVDIIFVSEFFSWWRSRPAPPPNMFLYVSPQNPTVSGTRKPNMRPLGKVQVAGASEIELNFNTHEDLEMYRQQERELHFRRLVYYIKRYGFYLLEAEDSSIKFCRFPWQSLLKRQWRHLERYLACREGISDPPFRKLRLAQVRGFVKVYDVKRDPPQSNEDLTDLELLANYCYLRNQRTREAFAVLKRQVYSLLGLGLGIIIAYSIKFDNLLLTQLSSAGMLSSGALYNLTNFAQTSMTSLAQYSAPNVFQWGIYVGAGMLMGMGSQAVHGWATYNPNRPPQRRPQFPVIQSGNVQDGIL